MEYNDFQQKLFQKIYEAEAIREYRLENWRKDLLNTVFQKLGINKGQSNEGLYLDIGCGTGYAVIEATKKGIHSIGVDLSSIGVKKAQCLAKYELSEETDRPDFIRCDGQYLPFRSNLFAKITCIQVIEHIPNDKRAIAEIARVGKNNCKVFVSTVNSIRRIAPPIRPLFYIHEKRAGHLRGYKHEDLIGLFMKKGFQHVDIMYYTHIPKLIQDSFCAIFPHLRWASTGIWREVTRLDLRFPRVPSGWTFAVLLKRI